MCACNQGRWGSEHDDQHILENVLEMKRKNIWFQTVKLRKNKDDF